MGDSVQSAKRSILNRFRGESLTNKFWVENLSGTQLESMPLKTLRSIAGMVMCQHTLSIHLVNTSCQPPFDILTHRWTHPINILLTHCSTHPINTPNEPPHPPILIRVRRSVEQCYRTRRAAAGWGDVVYWGKHDYVCGNYCRAITTRSQCVITCNMGIVLWEWRAIWELYYGNDVYYGRECHWSVWIQTSIYKLVNTNQYSYIQASTRVYKPVYTIQ